MSGNDERLFGLMQEIERVWMEDCDESVVDRLAGEHPEFAEELYLFFALLVDAPDQLELIEALVEPEGAPEEGRTA